MVQDASNKGQRIGRCPQTVDRSLIREVLPTINGAVRAPGPDILLVVAETRKENNGMTIALQPCHTLYNTTLSK
jgi:hypothetical protein